MMNGTKKSDSSIVPAKPANKVERSTAELVDETMGPRGMRNCKARSGHRVGKPCHKRRPAYEEL
jgi:hypothetical protein